MWGTVASARARSVSGLCSLMRATYPTGGGRWPARAGASGLLGGCGTPAEASVVRRPLVELAIVEAVAERQAGGDLHDGEHGRARREGHAQRGAGAAEGGRSGGADARRRRGGVELPEHGGPDHRAGEGDARRVARRAVVEQQDEELVAGAAHRVGADGVGGAARRLHAVAHHLLEARAAAVVVEVEAEGVLAGGAARGRRPARRQ